MPQKQVNRSSMTLRHLSVFSRLSAGLVSTMVVVLGVYVVFRVGAASQQLYLSPSSASVNIGQNITLAVRENSGTDPVNAVQANLTYNPAQLQFVAVDYTNSAFSLQASSSGGGGSVKMTRATGGGEPPVTGDNLIANVTFKALVGGVTSNITFASGSAVVRSTDNTNILTSSGTGSYVLVGLPTVTPTPTPTPPPPTPPLSTTPMPIRTTATPKPASTPTPVPGSKTPIATPTPVPTSDPLSVQSDNKNPPDTSDLAIIISSGSGSPVTVYTGSVPVVGGLITISTPFVASKVAIKLDGRVLPSDGKLDTSYLTNGLHTVRVEATQSDGTKKTADFTINAHNALNPYQIVRNTLFAPLHGNSGVINSIYAGVALIIILIFAYKLVGRIRRYKLDHGVRTNLE